MNDKFTNETKRDEEAIGSKLNQVAEGTQVSGQFAAELEERLRDAHPPRAGWFASFTQISPTLRWVALMILLAIVLSWSMKSLIPAPQPAIDNTPAEPVIATFTPEPNILPEKSATPVLQESEYDFRDAKLLLNQSLPQSPERAHVYLLNKEDTPATQEQARALAERFGIQGEIYTAPGYIFNTDNYVISDGKQSLELHSDKYFTYTSDLAKSRRAYPAPTNPDAEAIIGDFLNSHGFDFPIRVYGSVYFGGYVVQPLAPDSLPMQFESFTLPMMRVVLDENGQVLSVDASLIDFDQNPMGEYGIITAEEALQRLLDDSILTGKTELVHSAVNRPQEWYRDYPDNQPVTIYGYVSSNPALAPNKPSLLLINGIPVIGNTEGMESLENSTFIQATGQLGMENGIRKFTVASWDRRVEETYLTGILSRQGDQIVFISDDGGEQYTLVDPPADVPLDVQTPGSQLAITGVVVDGQMSWTYIQYFESNRGGGGGGGGTGLGFYKLNLSGTPVPFPSPTPGAATGDQPTGIYTVQEGDTLGMIAQRFGTPLSELVRLNNLNDAGVITVGQKLVVPMSEPTEQKVNNLRGFLSINIHNKADGSSSREYNLEVTQENGASIYQLQGPMLSELDVYNALPVEITGTINTKGILVVESYQIPYPDAHFQIMRGTQQMQQLEGQNVVVFHAEDGKSYVQFLATNQIPNELYVGSLGDLVDQEVLILPDESFGGSPVVHTYQSAIVQEGSPAMELQANKVIVFDDSNIPDLPTEFTQPNLIIENVELVYFVSNPYYQRNDPNFDQRSPYIQPVWHFQGHYEDGTAFDALIQALEQEFLLPELAPGITPG